jgi:hypothetical protein
MAESPLPSEEMRRAARRNAEAMKNSAIFLVIFNEDMIREVIPLIQMGLAVYLDKPVYILCPESRVLQIPENLRRMSQKLEIFPDDNMEEMQAAITRLMEGLKRAP